MSDRKYLEDGSQVEVIGIVGTDFVCQKILIDHEIDEEYLGKKIVVSQVFDNPPYERMHTEIAKLQETKQSLQQEIWDLEVMMGALHNEIIDIENKSKPILDRAKTIKALEKVFDYIDKKITHYVDRMTILTFEETFQETDDYRRERYTPKLLTLFGDSKGDIQWCINEYRDGSGSRHSVVPCQSFEEAKLILTERLMDFFEKNSADEWGYGANVETAKKFGIEVPQKYLIAMTEKLIAYENSALEEAQTKTNYIKKKIERLENEKLLFSEGKKDGKN